MEAFFSEKCCRFLQNCWPIYELRSLNLVRSVVSPRGEA